jgi:heat shock protein HtpX
MVRLAFQEVASNKFRSVILMAVFIAMIAVLGAAFGFYYGSIWFGVALACVAAMFYSLIMWFSGDSMILSMSGAKPVSREQNPHLYHTVEGIAIAAGLPTPKAYIINDTALNAFATGRDPKHASICFTSGILNKLSREELEGVIAHEMSHVGNFDIRFMMLTVVLVGVVTLMSDFLLRSFLWGGKSNEKRDAGQLGIILILVGLVLAILSPIIAQLVKLAISRKREFAADANAAILTRYPKGLANALRKISSDPDPLVDTANKATASLYISSPFRRTGKGSGGALANLWSTHPPISERIKRLEEM